MILNCMLATNFGGIAMLRAGGVEVMAVTREDCSIPARAARLGLPCESFGILSDWDPLTIARARRIVARHDPELIVVNGRKAHRVFARAVGRERPIVSIVHKTRFDSNLPCAGFIGVAEHRRRMLMDHGVPREKIVVIPNGVRIPDAPRTDYAVAPGAPVRIVALGRLDRVKGFDVLIDALALLARDVDFRCTIAGDGPERDKLQRQAGRLGLLGRIGFTGWVEDVASVLQPGDLFAFPSFREGFPVALLEALAYGLPVVSSKIEGPADFLTQDETALLVPSHNPPRLADGLLRLARNEALRRKLGKNGRRLAEGENSFAAIAPRLLGALNNVIAGRPIGAGA